MAGTTYVRTLDDEDMTPIEQVSLHWLRVIYRLVEDNGSCFDVLVRAAIELEEGDHR